MAHGPIGMLDPAIFESIQAKIDADAEFREQIKRILQSLEKQNRGTQWTLAKIHSTPTNKVNGVASEAIGQTRKSVVTIGELATAASKHPYYKYNTLWSREVQDLCAAVLFVGWLGGDFGGSARPQPGKLFTIEEVGGILQIPVNLKDQDAFHLSIEEYLHALINLIDELARLAVNSVTLGDFERPLQISQFIKDIHAGFQILNLKNDSLRRRSDSIKYSVKKVEDVVYDLSLRNLVPKKT